MHAGRTTQTTMALGFCCALAAVLCWSGNYIAARAMAGHIPPCTLTVLRWLLAGLILLPFCLPAFVREYAVIRRHKLYFAAVGIIGVSAFNPFLYAAGKTTGALNLALINTSSPALTILLGCLVLRERLSFRQLGGIVVACGGVVLLVLRGLPQASAGFEPGMGDLLAFIAALTFAVYTILLRYKPQGVSGRSFILLMAWIGIVPLLPFMALELAGGETIEVSRQSVGAVLYLALAASIGGYMFWNKAVSVLGAATTAPVYYLIPFFSGTEAMFLLGESVAWYHWAGGTLIICGIITASRRSP